MAEAIAFIRTVSPMPDFRPSRVGVNYTMGRFKKASLLLMQRSMMEIKSSGDRSITFNKNLVRIPD